MPNNQNIVEISRRDQESNELTLIVNRLNLDESFLIEAGKVWNLCFVENSVHRLSSCYKSIDYRSFSIYLEILFSMKRQRYFTNAKPVIFNAIRVSS